MTTPITSHISTAVASNAAAHSGSDAYLRDTFLVGAAKNILDVSRSAMKLPEAWRAGRFVPALAQTITASPTTDLIDPRAPLAATVESGGRSFTKLDAFGYRAAAFMGLGLGGVQLAYGVPNIVRAVHEGGATAIYDTRRGREGALQAAGGALTVGAFGKAVGAARAAGVVGAGPVLMAAATAPILASPVLLGTTIAASGLVFANSRGFLDFMNRGETRSLATVERDAWRDLGVPNAVRSARDGVTHAASAVWKRVTPG